MKRVLTSLLISVLIVPVCWAADRVEQARLVFGSFQSQQNATNWASRLSLRLNVPISAEPMERDDGIWYRVVSERLPLQQLDQLSRTAQAQKLQFWRLLDDTPVLGESIGIGRVNPQAPPQNLLPARSEETLTRSDSQIPPASDDGIVQVLDADLGLESQTFFESGLDGQSKYHPSASFQLDYYRSWDGGAQSFTMSPFFRYDYQDSDRTHFDMREMFWTRVGNDWDLHVGFKQVFWGVTEFNHLVDIINQTDLVENIDGEEKLGQPMVHLSLIRDWGIVDFMVLTGFRERTFPGPSGRLRRALEVETSSADYESGAQQYRIDGAIRWSHNIGPLDFGLYHFSGTSREPEFELRQKDNGNYYLKPYYPVIDQTGFDGQLILGDWAWKIEAISRSGFGDRYAAVTGGFERTLVGVFGGRTDLGLIAEYMWDQRNDDEALTILFEQDLALGTRWQINDVADTQALIGLIWDVQTHETILSVEASRRLGDTWTMLVEGRAFAGANAPGPNEALSELLDADNKLGPLMRDNYLQFEFTRYF